MYEILQSNTADGIEFKLRAFSDYLLIDFVTGPEVLTPHYVFKVLELIKGNNKCTEFICSYFSALIQGYESAYHICVFLEELHIEKTKFLLEANHKLHVIPVCYDEKFGSDLTHLSKLLNVDIKKIIELHFNAHYKVIMTGFLPAFFYLSGLPKLLELSRKKTPNKKVPQGSVAIANEYSGVYPVNSPGGWYILGRTPVNMIHSLIEGKRLIEIGDNVRFEKIDIVRYSEIEKNQENNKHYLFNEGQAIIVKAGGLLSIQDKGRSKMRAFGVQKSGPMNRSMYKVANQILNNPDNSTVLECAIGAVNIKFQQPTLISVVGMNLFIQVNHIVKTGNVISISAGDILEITPRSNQTYYYIGIKFGWQNEELLGSRSCNNHLGMSSLKKFDRLQYLPFSTKGLEINIRLPLLNNSLEFEPGPEFNMLSDKQKKLIYSASFNILPQSNRMAISLGLIPELCHSINIKSVPVIPGIIQLTPDGQIIILMYDCQTIGGYPRIGYLNEKSRDDLSMIPFGESIHFT